MINSSNTNPLHELEKSMVRGEGREEGGSSWSRGRGVYQSSSSSFSVEGFACTTGVEDCKSSNGGKKRGKMCSYRFHLEQEVQKLQKQLKQENDLHVALANAVAMNIKDLQYSPSQLPIKAQELLTSLAVLEITVLKLEHEFTSLHYKLTQERIERCLMEKRHRILPTLSPLPSSPPPPPSPPPLFFLHEYTWEEANFTSTHRHQVSRCASHVGPWKKVEKMDSHSSEKLNVIDSLSKILMNPLLINPNKLSEEMVRCMRNIFLSLSKSSTTFSCMPPNEYLRSWHSPVRNLSPHSSLAYSSDFSTTKSSFWSQSDSILHSSDMETLEKAFDPYRTREKVPWGNIGSYSMAAEASRMSVGKAQIDYATAALKGFSSLVEQLAVVNPAWLTTNEKIAFWINLYNALIMHAYLAYGVPKNDLKLFSLMQKVSYIVGGQSFSAAEIEYVMLKMKPPAHRSQLALILTRHKFRTIEVHRNYSVENPEPLVVFALSCGMYSSPAVGVFTTENVHDQLEVAMRDYVRASVGISDEGKLLVPKLLHCFSKSVVEYSLLVDWICRFLLPDQAAAVRDCASQRKNRFSGVRSFSVLPFDTRFRYLFLREPEISK